MAQRHEEKFLIDYRQYLLLKQRAEQVLKADIHGGSYVITSLYYDDLQDTALLEKQDGLARHTKFRLRTYDYSRKTVHLERKVKEGVLTQKRSAAVAPEAISQLGKTTAPFQGEAYELASQMVAAGLRPAVTVRYRRDAFYLPNTDVRLTFDTKLEALPAAEEMLFEDCCGIPVLDGNTVIMELKYGSYLPRMVRLLTSVPSRQLSVSKYALCREKFI